MRDRHNKAIPILNRLHDHHRRTLQSSHFESLYLTDSAQRLVSINQWNGGEVPRFHLGLTVAGNAWRFRADLPTALTSALTRLCKREPAPRDLRQTPLYANDYVRLLRAHMPRIPITRRWHGPAFVVPSNPDPIPSGPIQIVAITRSNATLLSPLMADWLPDVPHRSPIIAALGGNAAVAICASVSITPGAHAAGVETVPAFRGRGLARRVVAAWAREVRRLGALPHYSTSWDDMASQRVAAAVGAAIYAADFHLS
jgi:GNAT superfamily N-acetyltransferase